MPLLRSASRLAPGTGILDVVFAACIVAQGSIAWDQLQGKEDANAGVLCEPRTRALPLDSFASNRCAEMVDNEGVARVLAG